MQTCSPDMPRLLATPPRLRGALQMAAALLRFEQIHFIGLGNAVEALGPVGTGERQETVAPAKAGVFMDAQIGRRPAHAARIEHALRKIEPLGPMPQARQRRTAESVKGLAAGDTAIALQAVGAAMLMVTIRAANWTTQARCRRRFEPRDHLFPPRALLQQLKQLVALFKRQRSNPADEKFKVGATHSASCRGMCRFDLIDGRKFPR